MASVNRVILVGNLGKDPEVSYAPSGVQVAKFSVATTDSYKKDDEWINKTEWHNIILFNKQADFAGQYIKKGNSVYIEGKIQTRSWDDDSGQKKYMTEIVGNLIKNLTKKESTESTNDNYKAPDLDNDLPY